MKFVTYLTPAKVILSGEHAVVYGKPALTLALGKYIEVTVSEEGPSDADVEPFIKPVIETVHEYIKKEFPDTKLIQPSVTVVNAIPIGRGLGSSAAFAVGLSAALLHFYTGKEPDKNIVNTLAYKAEKHFHGTPSGADNTTCCFGGLIFFRKEFEFLKTISALNAKLPETIESHLILIDSGKPEEPTSEMVKQVRMFYNKYPEKAEEILGKIEKLTKRMVVAVVKEDAKSFQEILSENQKYLEMLDVVSDSTKALLKDLSSHGVGKVTGAGGKKNGSGYILFFAKDRKKTEELLGEHGIPFINFVQDFHGVHSQKPR
jgi:mevalonate kinase